VSVVLSEHLPLLASAPDGIKKLRGLILELAVRGKLVPQDPKDEPASELLKRIASNKAGQKSKPLVSFSDDERPFDVPESWQWTRFESVFSLEYGDNLPAPKRTNSGEFPVYGSNGIVGSHSECSVNSSCIVVGRKGSAGALNLCLNSGCWVTDVAYYCIPPKELDLLFCFKLFHTLGLAELGKGIKPGLSRSEAYVVPVAIPPLSEQHRIVAKVDELMALCDRMEAEQADAEAAHATLVQTLLGTLTQSRDATELAANWQRLGQHFDTLFTTEASLDALKQTVLQLAVMGKLVPQDPNDEPASELLKRIAAEKAKLIAEGKIKKDKPLPPVSEDEKPFELPVGWEWTRLQNAFDVRDGTHDTPKYVEHDGVPLITSRNFVDGKISFDDVKLISHADHESIKKRSGVSQGDILYSMIGGNIGNQVIVETEREFSIKNVALFKYYLPKDTLPPFLNLFLKTVTLSLQKKAAGGAQPFVSLSLLRNIPISIPPIAEQHRIVAKVDELMVLCDSLKAGLAESRARQARLATTLIESALQAA